MAGLTVLPIAAVSQARLELLGGFQLASGAGQSIALSARKPRALLAYLALSPGRAHSRERLAGLLWSDSSDLQARTSLRQALTALRRSLAAADAVISADAEQVSLAPATLAVDAVEFERCVALGTVESLQRALLLYRGDLLDGVSTEAPAFEQWVVAERERLRSLAVQGLAALLGFQRRNGLTDQAVETAARLVALDPLREDAQRELMRLYLQQGRMVEALKQYQVLRQMLARELGVPPAPETEQLYRELLQQRRSSQVSEPPFVPSATTAPPSAVAPDVRHAIVMLIDLPRFTAFTGEIDPEAVHQYLLCYRGKIGELMQRYGGVVTNYIGARVMAAFGVPTAHDNDAERAVRAALALRDIVPAIPAPGNWVLRPQVGLASGALFADGTSGQLIISGEPVSMAARIMEQADSGEVLASGWVRHALGDRLQVDSMPTISIRAAARPLQVWRVVQWLDRVPSMRPFVGRHSELRQLAGVLDGCSTSRTAQVVLLRGEAGIGKTRLLEEMTRTARARGFVSHRVLVLDFGGGTAGQPIPALALALLGVADSDNPQRVQGAIARAMAEGTVDRDLAPLLCEMLDVQAPHELAAQATTIDGEGRQRAEQTLLAGLIGNNTRHTPLLIVVEDIHWADEGTLSCFARLASAARGLPVVLALSTRPESDPIGPAWRAACAGCPVMTVDLGPLTDVEARELAASYHCQDERLVDSCVKRAEGNPLFLDQLLRSVQSGRGALPSTVQSIVLARLDSLDARDRQALQAASVLGQRFSAAALQHLTGVENSSCADMIDKGLMRPQGDDYLFSHALIREAAYASVLRSRRQQLHRRAAEWFASRDAALTAEHLDAAEDPDAAAAYERAARAEAERHQHERALTLAERGLALARDSALRSELSCLTGELLLDLGRTEASVAAYRKALEVSETGQQKSRALFGLASGLRILDRLEEALATVDRAEAFARQYGDAAELAQLWFLRGNLYLPLGEIDACLAAHEQARIFAEQARSPVLEARALGSLGDAHYLRGEMLTAHEYFRRCVELSRAGNLPGVASTCLPMLGFTHFYRNEPEAALSACQEATGIARRAGNLRAELLAWDVLSMLHAYGARWQQAHDDASRALALAQRVGARRFEADTRGILGVALHGLGEQERAEQMLQKAYTVSREVGVKQAGPWILGSLARITRDADTRATALSEGDRLLDEGCVSHSHLHFYETAIEACLASADLARAERYAKALREYTRREPLPWSEFFVRRGLALVQAGRRVRTTALRAELDGLVEEAEQAGLFMALPALEAAQAALAD